MSEKDLNHLLNNFARNLFLKSDTFAYLVIIPVTAVIFYYSLNLPESYKNIYIITVVIITVVAAIINVISTRKILKPITVFFKKWQAGEEITDEEYVYVRNRFFSLPKIRATATALRFGLLIPVVILVMNLVTSQLTLINQINMWSLAIIDTLVGGMLYFVTTEREVFKIASSGIFNRGIEFKPSFMNRMSTVLSMYVIIATTLVLTLMMTIMFNLESKMLEKAYLNQMENVTKLLDHNTEKFLNESFTNVFVTSKRFQLVQSIKNKDYKAAEKLLKASYEDYKDYENIFISTPEPESIVLAAAIPESAGENLRSSGYTTNIDAALQGKTHLNYAAVSKATNIPSMLITVPVIDETKVIAILGFSIDLRKFSSTIVQHIRIGNTGYAFVTDPKLVTIAHPDNKILMQNITQYDFGKKMAVLESGNVRYWWETKAKTIYFIKNKAHGFYTASTINISDIEMSAWNIEILMILVGVIGMGMVGIFLYFMITFRLKPIKISLKLIDGMTEGYLNQKTDLISLDEVGEMSIELIKFIDTLKQIVKKFKASAEEMALSSDQMSTTTTVFSDNAQNQAASAEEITATVEQVSAGIENIANGAAAQFETLSSLIDKMNYLSQSINTMSSHVDQANVMTKSISEKATSGEKSMTEMNISMNTILSSSSEMRNIVGIINDISEQINLLSLNASIEAARAGDAGRGFAVVADEISKLADETASSIKEIDRIIKSNNEEISKGMTSVRVTTSAIVTIIEGVNSITSVINEISKNMKDQTISNAEVNSKAQEARRMSDGIKNATEEQKAATIEIVRSIGSINELTQANASGSEEMSVSASSVATLADSIKKSIDFFKI